jgi:DNA-binding HxlR family transcriptional regulator
VGSAPTSNTGGAVLDHTAEAPTGSGNGAGVCPYFHEAVELLGKRWTGAVVHVLLRGPTRFSQITHAIPQISDRLLSIRLKELETFGIVTRSVYGGSPVRVEYELTAKGRALEPTVTALRSWACEWLPR